MNPYPTQSTPDISRHGFALVLALSMMAFVLLLVLSLTALIQIETSSAQTHLQTLQARETARLALTMAIGQVQKHASHDQRVTARAEILGEDQFDPTARFWTGVWNTEAMSSTPAWLVSGIHANPREPDLERVRLVGPGTVGNDTAQYVYVPTIKLFDANGTLSAKLAWWVSDEGVKTSAASLPINERPTLDILNKDNALQLQLASTHGLEAIFSKYDRFSANSAKMLDRLNSIKQLKTFETFDKSTPDTSREALFHTLTLNSYGVLASTTDTGLMQDLSLFPNLLGSGLQNYLQLGETHANQLATQTNPIAKKLLFTKLVGLEEIGALQKGDIATPIIPILSNFMIAFTIRSRENPPENDNFLLRARFFCEFWNPYTHTLSMFDGTDDPIHLELEITGLPEVTVRGKDGEGNFSSSAPINLQEVMGDPTNSDNAVVIRLVNNSNEPWLPGRSKNWVGLETVNDPIHSPYKSIDTQTKLWPRNDRTLGGVDGIDTGKSRIEGTLQHASNESHKLRIKVHKVTETSRRLLSDMNGFFYERVDTAGGYLNDHSGMTFGYHIILREPHHSNDSNDYFRGMWLRDHDPRSPMPLFRNNWHLDNDIHADTGSPYFSVFDGLTPMNPPEPNRIHQRFASSENTIDSDRFERLLDCSKGSGNYFYDLWQDTPLFELPRRRILSLASLQHIYMHNERPFQVGNSWGNEGKYNTSKWFDHYFFSGLSQNDTISDFNLQSGPPNPGLRFVSIDSLRARFPHWTEASTSNSMTAREPAQNFMVANRFNINSTSVDAWKAVLSSLRFDDFKHLNWPDETTSNLNTLQLSQVSQKQGSFTRFSHSLEETYQAPASPNKDNIAPSAFYRHGVRHFDSEQFEALAEEIVRLIREKGTPFKSMEEFLSELSSGNGSLLEQAIRNVLTDPITRRQQWRHSWETTGEHKEDETPIDIDHFSPGFLTQADIMTAIGPMLAPRSDTFKIRARGECFDDFGKPIGLATLEAVLQRTSEAIDTTVQLDKPTNRKWKLTSMRWLQEDEI